MANPFDDTDNEILEGFLCPICREDMKSPERLTSHVENSHADHADLLKSLKDIFSKAKQKIRQNFEENKDFTKSLTTPTKSNCYQSKTDIILSLYQEVGVDCNHMSYFEAVRTPRLERYASETNKLIIRLHKLLKNRPIDPVQRKLHEQKTVPWIEGKSVKLCPSCAKSFNITRRQHHCRLCGSIMCNDCSLFLIYKEAMSMVNINVDMEQEDNTAENNNINNIRTCDHCLRLLEARKEMQDSRNSSPMIVKYYEKIVDIKKESVSDIQMYVKMIDSLYEGDTIFTISDVSALRGKIGHMAEKIDILSKAILAINFVKGSREEALKKSVHLASIQYIKEKMLSIPSIPLEEELDKLKRIRKLETEQKIETERRLALEAYERLGLKENSPVNSSNNARSGSAVTTLDNWSGQQISLKIKNDPLVEQINNIKGYIKQAREALRFEEVAILEVHLRELQHEFYRQHQQI